MPKRVLIVVAIAAAASLVAVYLSQPERGVPEGAPTLEEMARDVGSDVMRHLWVGHVPGRSGEIMLVPKPHNFLIGEWDLTTLGTDQPTLSTSHPNPWDYLARIPIVLYGRGWAPAGVVREDQVDISYLAPTYARLLGGVQGFDPQNAAGLPGIRCKGPSGTSDDACAGGSPKVIFTVVIDGGGWNALQQHAHAWPNIEWLMDNGTTYTNATIGSAPSITGALHATFGTGVYPIEHGIPGNQMRGEDGKNTDTWLQNADPRYLDAPTVSELWDEQNGNRPWVGTVSYEGWHLGMIGHGAQREGGDKDVAVLWEAETEEWFVNEDYYSLPDYLPEPERLFDYIEEIDVRDGLEDGAWFGQSIEDLMNREGEEGQRQALARPGTPAFVRLTGDAVVDVLRKEPIGDDALTDLFWIEMKMPDYAGHAWNMEQREQEDVIRETDAQIGRFRKELDRLVGKGNYVFAISADHGQQPLPDLHGGWRINNKELQRDIEGRFGDVIEKVTPVDVYVDRDRVEEDGLDIDDIARYLATYTIGENIPEGAEGADRVPEARLDETLFAGAFTRSFFESLDSSSVGGFGCGIYPEGDLYRRSECARLHER